MNGPYRGRIVVADVRESISTLAHILGESVQLLPATSLDRALKRLDEGADLVLCGVHFDQSRMFDLLRMAKASPRSRAVPFVCYRDMRSELPAPFLEGLDIACKALGAAEFLDLYEMRKRHGIGRADELFHAAVMGHLGGSQRRDVSAC